MLQERIQEPRISTFHTGECWRFWERKTHDGQVRTTRPGKQPQKTMENHDLMGLKIVIQWDINIYIY